MTLTGAEAIPLATTTIELAPVSMPAGTSNVVEAVAVDATAIVLWLWVLQ